jgi:sec-independent protein translocase protein TatA
MGLDNPLHIAFLLIVLLLVFGAKRLPEIGRSVGAGMREFKDSISGQTPMLTQTPQQPQPVATQQQPQAVAQPVAAQQAPAAQQPVAQPAAAPAPPSAPAPAEAPAEPAQRV